AAARSARALGVLAVRADPAQREPLCARRRRRQGEPPVPRRGGLEARRCRRAARQRPRRVRRRGGGRRRLGGHLGRAGSWTGGRLPASLRAGATPPTAEELAAWAQLPSGTEELSHYGGTPIAPGAAEEFHLRVFADTSLDVNGIAGGSPDLVKTVLPVEARAN